MRRYRDRKTEDLLIEQMEAPAFHCGDWRDIPGYGGMYQISREGAVRTWRYRGERRLKEPKPMQQYMRHRGERSRRRVIKLTDANGIAREVPVLGLMVEVWLGGSRPGMVPYHKNGDLGDHNVNNIGFASRKELGRMTGASSSRIPVAKVTPAGDVVAVYSSARAAARANHMSYQAVLDRCNGKVKRPYALDGHTYIFDR